ncbi:hypothetical protein ACLB2K_061545 [Fragaria x ananassa]
MTKPSAASTRLLARLLDDLRFGLDCISPASGFQPRLGSDDHRLPTLPLRYRRNPTFAVDVSHINTISEVLVAENVGSVAPMLSDQEVAEVNRLIDDLTALNSKPVGSVMLRCKQKLAKRVAVKGKRTF